jgi:UrcA family protein
MLMRSALLAGIFGVALAATSASAQDYNEQIEVTAPHFRADNTQRLNGVLQKVSYSNIVHYDDLNLRTRSGARELRLRVRDEAQDVCARLAEAYPVREMQGTSCYKEALENALVRADAAIRDAREYRRYND